MNKPFSIEESENIQKVNNLLMKQNQELKLELIDTKQVVNAQNGIIKELEEKK